MRRLRRRRRKSGGLFLMLLFVGLLAVGCGWLINSLIVKGYLFAPAIVREVDELSDQPEVQEEPTQEQPTPEEEVTESEFQLQALRFYLTQVGALSSEANAKAMVQQLASEGYPGAYVQDGKFYKVFAGVYSAKEAASGEGALLQQLGHEVYVKEAATPGGSCQATGSQASYFAKASEQIAVMEEAFQDLLAAESINGAKAKTLRQQVDGAYASLQALSPASDLQSMHTALLNACSKLLAAAKKTESYLGSNDENDLISARSSLMTFSLDYQRVQTIIISHAK